METEPDHPANRPDGSPFSGRLLLFGLFVLMLEFVTPVCADGLLRETGFFAWYYGPEPVDAAKPADDEVMRTRQGLWSTALALPMWSAGVALVLWKSKAVRPDDVGISRKAGGRNACIGIVAGLILTPLLLALNYGISELLQAGLGFEIKQHPLTSAGEKGLLSTEWGLLAFAVMVAAPLREELVFRGVLQRLFTEHRLGSFVGIGLAVLVSLSSSLLTLTRHGLNFGTWSDRLAVLSALMPVLFVVALAVCGVVSLRARRAAALGVFSSALLFAAIHSFAWPTPVALFVLGLGLGYLALRTRSLVAPIMVHSVFNAVSFLLLFLGWAG
jgi:membrane protease YdiL (CAAX protease family)